MMVFALSGFTRSKEYKEINAKVVSHIKIPHWYHEGIYLFGNDIWVNNGERGDTWVINKSSGNVTRSIKSAGPFTEAVIPKDKDTFYASDWDAEKVFISDIEENKMCAITEKSVGPAHPAGVAWNGSNLFVITWTRSMTGTKFHLLKMDPDLNILSSEEIDKILEPAHMAWDGKYMWISCWFSKRIYKIDLEKSQILGYMSSPANRTTGIAWDGKDLWVTGTYDDLYKLELVD